MNANEAPRKSFTEDLTTLRAVELYYIYIKE